MSNQNQNKAGKVQVNGLSVALKVYHLTDLRSRKAREETHNKAWMDVTALQDIALAKRIFVQPSADCAYVQVAKVTGSAIDIDMAYRLTNSIDEPWWKNEGVYPMFAAQGCRSTSVGDVIIDPKGHVHFCASFGWKNLGGEDQLKEDWAKERGIQFAQQHETWGDWKWLSDQMWVGFFTRREEAMAAAIACGGTFAEAARLKLGLSENHSPLIDCFEIVEDHRPDGYKSSHIVNGRENCLAYLKSVNRDIKVTVFQQRADLSMVDVTADILMTPFERALSAKGSASLADGILVLGSGESFDLCKLIDDEVRRRASLKLGPFKMANDGINPLGLVAECAYTGDPGIYDEARISVLTPSGECVGDALVGLTDTGELRVLVTSNSDGDGDHPIAVYPMRKLDNAIEVDQQLERRQTSDSSLSL